MGVIVHDAVVVSTWREEDNRRFEEFRDQIVDLAIADEEGYESSLSDKWAGTLVGPISQPVNMGYTWVLTPDGSKEGWSGSDFGDQVRERFVALCRRLDVDFVHVQFGGDLERPRIQANG
jgi:hypothetical protein